MALASRTDLEAIGALRVGQVLSEDDSRKADALLEMASAQVCVYLDTTEAVIGAWTATWQTVVRQVTAQLAGLGLSFPAHATAQQVIDSGGAPMRMRLTKSMKEDLDMIPRTTGGSGTLTLETADYTAQVNWDGWPSSGADAPVTSTETTWTW